MSSYYSVLNSADVLIFVEIILQNSSTWHFNDLWSSSYNFGSVLLERINLTRSTDYSTASCSFSGVVDYMTTEISTSKQKKFSLVTFVDTPGLVDGDMKYLFDVDRAILWLGINSTSIVIYILLLAGLVQLTKAFWVLYQLDIPWNCLKFVSLDSPEK